MSVPGSRISARRTRRSAVSTQCAAYRRLNAKLGDREAVTLCPAAPLASLGRRRAPKGGVRVTRIILTPPMWAAADKGCRENSLTLAQRYIASPLKRPCPAIRRLPNRLPVLRKLTATLARVRTIYASLRRHLILTRDICRKEILPNPAPKI